MDYILLNLISCSKNKKSRYFLNTARSVCSRGQCEAVNIDCDCNGDEKDDDDDDVDIDNDGIHDEFHKHANDGFDTGASAEM